MGESLACNNRLAGEYNRILVSYIRPDGNFLEHPQLQKGLLWGLARLASVHPEQVKDAGPFLMPFLESQDPDHRGLASLAAGLLQEENARKALERLCRDGRDFHLYRDYRLESVIVGDMAQRALSAMSN
jgi:hypothetical protein